MFLFLFDYKPYMVGDYNAMKKLLSIFLLSVMVISLSITAFASTDNVDQIFKNLKNNNQQYTSVIENGEESFYVDMSQYPENMTREEIMNAILEGRKEAPRNFVENN